MRLGPITGDKIKNERGVHLFPWLLEQGFTLRTGKKGVLTFMRNGPIQGTSIVDHAMSNLPEELHKIGKQVVTEDDLGGSDHRMIITEIIVDEEKGENVHNGEEGKQIALCKLKDHETRL